MNLKNRSLITLRDFSREEILYILKTAADIKTRFKAGEVYQPLKGKMLAMIFQKPSLRTRVSFETGMYQLGGAAMYLGPGDIGLGKRETTISPQPSSEALSNTITSNDNFWVSELWR